MKVTFLGHSALLVEDKNFKGLIDPFLTGNPLYKSKKEHTEGITHIFITHAHGDHVGDAVKIALDNKAIIISNAEIANTIKLDNPEIETHAMHIGGRFEFQFGQVKMTPALHGSSFFKDGNFYDGGNPGGFLIDIDNKSLYHAGDTGLTYDMKLLEDEEVDLAFLPIGGNYTMDIDDAVRAVHFIKPKITVPMHYNTFGLIQADPTYFVAKLPDFVVKILKPGKSITI
ncbi:metal-dependent hydrolase [Candidatus Izimaplasma bacterium HR1]|jgi:L-ascorbate metabolism protein UlaG (beta-lactamase superfamily)|uniref:metal-dependent hydrolase n=1 Tax=Candidatus Izimoplasma sp. HR1 TaxID=1541959 RepID=UPI0004F78C90|nr:metal-dependent hydrolase [Candidatus Izimaplasma bacterium HR1]